MDERDDRTRTARLLLVASGSVACGVHAGLAPVHLREWPPLGVSFVAAALTAGFLAVAVCSSPSGSWVRALGLVLAGLVGAYVATRVVALPPLDPEREPLDPLGLLTVAAEAVGVLAALRLVHTSTSATYQPALTPGGSR